MSDWWDKVENINLPKGWRLYRSICWYLASDNKDVGIIAGFDFDSSDPPVIHVFDKECRNFVNDIVMRVRRIEKRETAIRNAINESKGKIK